MKNTEHIVNLNSIFVFYIIMKLLYLYPPINKKTYHKSNPDMYALNLFQDSGKRHAESDCPRSHEDKRNK